MTRCTINDKEYNIRSWEIELMNNECLLRLAFKESDVFKDFSKKYIIKLEYNDILILSSEDIILNQIRTDNVGDIGATITFKCKILNKDFAILNKQICNKNYDFHFLLNNEKYSFKFATINKIKEKIYLQFDCDKPINIDDENYIYIYKNDVCIFKVLVANSHQKDYNTLEVKDINFINTIKCRKFTNFIQIDNIEFCNEVIAWGYQSDFLEVNFNFSSQKTNNLFKKVTKNDYNIKSIKILNDDKLNNEEFLVKHTEFKLFINNNTVTLNVKFFI